MIYSNLTRLDLIVEDLLVEKPLLAAKEELESCASRVVESLVEGTSAS